jgi:hypothetical protein
MMAMQMPVTIDRLELGIAPYSGHSPKPGVARSTPILAHFHAVPTQPLLG